MADAECCFGFFNVYGGTWAIAVFNMWFFGSTITMIIFWCVFKTLKAEFTLTIVAVACQLLALHTIIYFNNNLQKSTYVHNILHVQQWLIFHLVFYATATIMLFCVLLLSHCEMFLATVVISIGVQIYQIHVVKRFYINELKLSYIYLRLGREI